MTDSLLLESVRYANVNPYDCFGLPTTPEISQVGGCNTVDATAIVITTRSDKGALYDGYGFGPA
jgi:hypothetical protein